MESLPTSLHGRLRQLGQALALRWRQFDSYEFWHPVDAVGFARTSLVALALMGSLYWLLAPAADRGEEAAKANAYLAQRQNALSCERATLDALSRAPADRDYAQLRRTCHPEDAVVREMRPVIVFLGLAFAGAAGLLLVVFFLTPRF